MTHAAQPTAAATISFLLILKAFRPDTSLSLTQSVTRLVLRSPTPLWKVYMKSVVATEQPVTDRDHVVE